MNIQRVKFKDIEQIPSININKNFKQNFQGSSPAPFIGRYGYPNINVGFLSPQFSGDTSHYDSPKQWSSGRFPIGSIASLRYGLVNSRTEGNITGARKPNRFLEIIQEVGMAKKAVELEVNLNKIPQLQLKSQKEIIPFGPASKLQKARITANPKVDSRVERVVYDTDLKSAPGIISLYKKGFEENFLTKLMSVGNTGLKKNRILVPTRWSITAVDDTVGKDLIKEVKDYSAGDYQLYFGGEWGNYYLVMFFPEIWSYELFEMYLGHKVNAWSKAGNFYSTDYENYAGRKSYAEECAGGYYAARLPVLEKMKEQKRQQSALVLRFISPEYNVPLGVWVCREASRKSLSEKPLSFGSQELMFKYAKELMMRKFSFDIDLLLKESKLLKNKKEQRKLGEFT
jgi:DNA repair protein NreA